MEGGCWSAGGCWWMRGLGKGDNSASLFVVSGITCSGNLFGSSCGVSDPPFFKALPVAFVRKVNKHHFTFPNFPLRPKLQFMDFNHHCSTTSLLSSSTTLLIRNLRTSYKMRSLGPWRETGGSQVRCLGFGASRSKMKHKQKFFRRLIDVSTFNTSEPETTYQKPVAALGRDFVSDRRGRPGATWRVETEKRPRHCQVLSRPPLKVRLVYWEEHRTTLSTDLQDLTRTPVSSRNRR